MSKIIQVNNNNYTNVLAAGLVILFTYLKLTGTIDWSWWWVTAPIWLPAAVVLTILGVGGVFFLIFKFLGEYRK